MLDVAAAAGVSLSTVSRVINDDGLVGPVLAARVGEAVEALGYRRDDTASSLRRADRVSASVGLIFPDVSDPFFAVVHRGAEEVAHRRGVLMFAGSTDEDPRRAAGLSAAFSARNVDGLIVVPSGNDQSYLVRDHEAGTALVFVDRPPRLLEADTVVSDNAGGVREAARALLDGGHRRIGYLGDRRRIFTAVERLRGYREALAERGVPEEPALVHMDRDGTDAAHSAVLAMLGAHDPPTGIVSGQNLLSMGAVNALREHGLQHTVALIGFDDLPLAAALEPPLSVVAQDPEAIGRRAAELLFTRIDGHDGPPRRVTVSTTFLRRGSGEIPPARPGGIGGRRHARAGL